MSQIKGDRANFYFLWKMFLSNLIMNTLWKSLKPESKCCNVCGNVLQVLDVNKWNFSKDLTP